MGQGFGRSVDVGGPRFDSVALFQGYLDVPVVQLGTIKTGRSSDSGQSVTVMSMLQDRSRCCLTARRSGYRAYAEGVQKGYKSYEALRKGQ